MKNRELFLNMQTFFFQNLKHFLNPRILYDFRNILQIDEHLMIFLTVLKNRYFSEIGNSFEIPYYLKLEKTKTEKKRKKSM